MLLAGVRGNGEEGTEGSLDCNAIKVSNIWVFCNAIRT